MKKGSILLLCIIALVAFAAWAPNVNAFSNLYDDNCAGCHGATQTCAGCHAHGVHSNAAKNDINVTVTTDKAEYLPGETVTVSVTGGYRAGWVRAKLFDESDNEVDMASNDCPSCPVGVGGVDGVTAEFPGPIELTAQAPLTTGAFIWSASWYGNEFDSGSAAFGDFVEDPNNSGHGDEIITFTFDVVECAVDADCDDGVACTVDICDAGTCSNTPDDPFCDDGLACTGVETCDPVDGCLPGTPVDCPPGQICEEPGGVCVDAGLCEGVVCDPTGNQCTVNVCDPTDGICKEQNAPDGSACDDGDVCNGADECTTGVCEPVGPPLDCDDGEACTGVETCDPVDGCLPGTPVECPPGQICEEPGGVCVDACECDLNSDGKCDMEDFLIFGQDWGRTDCGTPPGSGNPPNDCECDITQDGKCDMQDYLPFGEDWGRIDCP
jgi:hypothetical protein